MNFLFGVPRSGSLENLSVSLISDYQSKVIRLLSQSLGRKLEVSIEPQICRSNEPSDPLR